MIQQYTEPFDGDSINKKFNSLEMMTADCNFADINRYIDVDFSVFKNMSRLLVLSIMGSEALQAIQDLRWMITLCIVLIIADYRFGRAESKKKHAEAIEQHNDVMAKMYEFRFSRAMRRTCNKFVDYMMLLLVCCLIGLAVTEPYGICSHVITAGVAVIVACMCELWSIGGHFCYLKGINVRKPDLTWKSFFVFAGRLAAGFAKTKDEDFGNALDDTITQTLNDEKK